jgi:hypothetical protein
MPGFRSGFWLRVSHSKTCRVRAGVLSLLENPEISRRAVRSRNAETRIQHSLSGTIGLLALPTNSHKICLVVMPGLFCEKWANCRAQRFQLDDRKDKIAETVDAAQGPSFWPYVHGQVFQVRV